MSLVPVHGGLSEPVNRVLPLPRRKSMLAEAASMPKFSVTEADLATVGRIADGTLSPLNGPMTEAQWNLSLDKRVIESNGSRYAWTIPLAFPVTDEEAAGLKVGGQAAILGPDGSIVGFLEVSSVYDWDKAKYIQSVYGTDRTDHPGGNIAMNDARTKLVGGDMWALPGKRIAGYGDLVNSPRQTRQMIAEKGWEKALAFQTRNPLHRAHEYALVHGVQELTRAGHFTGVVLNPLVGELKGDDVDAPTRMMTYKNLRDMNLLGTGDADADLWDGVGYGLNEIFELIGLDMKMFYGGPAEAVMHGIYRQNHGFSHIVIGRQHADAPFADGGAIWGPFDAQAIFDELPGELHVKPMKVGFAAYYKSMGRVDLMSNHTREEETLFISGKKVRAMLIEGARPPSEIMRGETADILIQAYSDKGISA
jgi:sulfate adenylyltransferase